MKKLEEAIKARVDDAALECCLIKQAALQAIDSDFAIESLANHITNNDGDMEGVLTHIGQCVNQISLCKEDAAVSYASYKALVAVKQGHLAFAKWKSLVQVKTREALTSCLGMEVMMTNSVEFQNFTDAVARVAEYHDAILTNADIGLLSVARALGDNTWGGVANAIPFKFQTEQQVAQSTLVQSGDTAGNQLQKYSWETFQDKSSFSSLVNDDWVDAQINLVRFMSIKQLGVKVEKDFDLFTEHMAEKLCSGKVGAVYHALSTTYYNLPMQVDRLTGYIEYLDKAIKASTDVGMSPYKGNFKDKNHNIEEELYLQEAMLKTMLGFKDNFETFKYYRVISSAAALMRDNDNLRPESERKNFSWKPYRLAAKFTKKQFEMKGHSEYIDALVVNLKERLELAGFEFELKEFEGTEWYETGAYTEKGAKELAAMVYALRAAMRGITDTESLEAAQAVADSIDEMNVDEFNSAF